MVSAVCQAKDPSTCKYHGAVLRMNEAMKTGDFNAYYLARKEVEEQEKQGFKETTPASPFIKPLEELMNTTPTVPAETITQPAFPPQVSVKTPEGNSITFRRHDHDNPDTAPNWPYFVRVEFPRPITEDETTHLAQLLGYSARTNVRGESLGQPHQDTPNSFYVAFDSTKTRRDDIGQAIEDFEESYQTCIKYGTPTRLTNRAGEGTLGTKLINGVDENLSAVFYYD